MSRNSPQGFCSLDSCERPLYARGWCRLHYGRARVHGGPLAGPTFKGAGLAWLERQIVVGDRYVCWECPGSGDRGGYVRVTFRGRRMKAHQVALILDGRPRPGNLLALHSCDNPPCCNPAHLRWGTDWDNLQDSIRRGRARSILQPELSSPLTRADVAEIVRLGASDLSRLEIGRRFGVTETTVGRILRGDTWSRVTGIRS